MCRTLVLLIAAAASLTAATAQDLVGSWVVDRDASWREWEKTAAFQQVPADMRATVKQAAFEQMARLSFDITADAMTRSDGPTSATSSYKILSTEGDVLTIESAGDDKQPRPGRVEVRAGTLVIGGGKDDGVLVLARKPAKPAAEPEHTAK